MASPVMLMRGMARTGAPVRSVPTGGDLPLKAGGAATITGSNLRAGHDISLEASSMAFKTVAQSLKQTQDSMSSYYGVSGGLTGDSVLGSVVQSALAASQAKGKGRTVLRTFNAMQGVYQLGTGLSTAVALILVSRNCSVCPAARRPPVVGEVTAAAMAAAGLLSACQSRLTCRRPEVTPNRSRAWFWAARP